MSKRIRLLFLSAFAVCLFLTGCVDQHPETAAQQRLLRADRAGGQRPAARALHPPVEVSRKRGVRRPGRSMATTAFWSGSR